MLQEANKDITTVTRGIVAHGVNCQRVMGSGVAKAIKTKWPIIYTRYMNVSKEVNTLGSADIIPIIPDELYVANCYTQFSYGRNGKYASETAIEDSLVKVFLFAIRKSLPVYLPKIGCGLGGLDWELDVYPIIQSFDEFFNDLYPGKLSITICTYS